MYSSSDSDYQPATPLQSLATTAEEKKKRHDASRTKRPSVDPQVIRKALERDGVPLKNLLLTKSNFSDSGLFLGKGAFGNVTLGTVIREGVKHTAALKRLHARRITPDGLQQCRMEIEIMSRVHAPRPNPRVVRLLGVDFQDKTEQCGLSICMALELCDNGTLHALVSLLGGLGPLISRTYLAQLVEGVQALHKAGYIHRDLKPENLLLDRNFNLKVADFGISARLTGGLGVEHRCWPGTKLFMSPEVKERTAYDESYDVWSIGVILFIFLCGAPPFDENGVYWDLLTKRKHFLFWCFHQHYHFLEGNAQDLINRMLMFDRLARISLDGVRRHPWYAQQTLSNDIQKGFRLRKRILILMRHADPAHASEVESKLERDKLRDLEQVADAKQVLMRPMKEVLEKYFISIPSDIMRDTVQDMRGVKWAQLTAEQYLGRLAGISDTMNGAGPLQYSYVITKQLPVESFKTLVAFFRVMNKYNSACTYKIKPTALAIKAKLVVTLEDESVVRLKVSARVYKFGNTEAVTEQSLVVFNHSNGEADKFRKFFIVAQSVLTGGRLR